ncbi:MAG: bifunctional riboflavin kinase/FMN adenylyltransferase, partial [Ginsengibacter sp.]
PHPRMVISKTQENKADIKLLTTLPEKIELLQKQNIDHLVIVPFTLEFSQKTAEEYIKDFLVEKFHPHSLIIVYYHRFGNKRQGDYKLLESYQAKFNFKVKEIPEHVLHHVTISSTRIRHALAEEDINTANEYLGYSYFFEGSVVDGDKIGRDLGYPTANIEVTEQNKLIPADGIYVVEVSLITEANANDVSEHENIIHPTSNIIHLKGMMSIGFRPTVGGTKKVIEVNIFDFDRSIYGETIRVYVKYFLRKEVKFNGLEELKEQLTIDRKNALQLLNEN